MPDRRKNGFSWPPDKAQLLTLFFIIYFGLMFPGTFIVSLTGPWIYIISITFGLAFACLLTLLVIIMWVDPSEFSDVKKKKITPASFDRTQHKNVIENQYCNICKSIVSYKAKHCRKCNKCVTDFDHHCVYLNNCIGSKNYKIFIAVVVNACVGAFLIFLIGVIEFSFSFVNDQYFLTSEYFQNSLNCTYEACDDKYKFLPVLFIKSPINVWRVFTALTSFLALFAFGLIAYLLGYHVYLKIHDMSTYEHSLLLRNQETKSTPAPKSIESSTSTHKNIKLKIPEPKPAYPESQKISSIDETIPVNKSSRLERQKTFLANEVNYFELSSKESIQNQDQSPRKQREPIVHEPKETSRHIDSPNDKDFIFATESSLDVNSSGSNIQPPHSRIPCMNLEPKNKYSKFNGGEQFTSESSNSVYSQRQIPLFLPLSKNLSDNEDDLKNIHVRRSSRKSKIVKLPVNYDDTSPELTVRNSKEVPDHQMNSYKSLGSSRLSVRSNRSTKYVEKTDRPTPNYNDSNPVSSRISVRSKKYADISDKPPRSERQASFTTKHGSDSDESVQIRSMRFDKAMKTFI